MNKSILALTLLALCIPATALGDGEAAGRDYAVEEYSDEYDTSRAEKKATTTGEFSNVDRSKRTSPYSATPFNVMSGSGYGEASRYSTDQGWSRGRNSSWWGGYGSGRSDIPNAGYTAAPK